MAKKKKAEEHENLERWLVSYADFMTLLFATFVVLYALAQTDVNSFKSMEEALKKAFTQNIFDNSANIMQGSESIFEGQKGQTNPLMLEYMSPKYEESSYEEIKKDVDKMKKDGVSAEIDERGLVIRLDNQVLQFKPGSADIGVESYPTLEAISKLIKQKFKIHYIQVEGHTDSDPVSNSRFPSNWELSSARASSVVRYLISKQNFDPKIFIAVGLADTVPVNENSNSVNKAKNRRVEIVVLKNKNRFLSKKNMQKILEDAKRNADNSEYGIDADTGKLIGDDKSTLKSVVDLNATYDTEKKRLEQLENEDFTYDGSKPDFME